MSRETSAPDKYAECRGHTPGPLHVEEMLEDRAFGQTQRALYIVGGAEDGWSSGGRTVAVVGCWEDRPNPEADAALFRLAPTLLAENDELRSEVATLRAQRDALTEGLEEIAADRGRCLYSTSRGAMDGNEAFMEGTNAAFERCGRIAADLLSRHRGES